MGWIVSTINSLLLTVTLGLTVPAQEPPSIWKTYGKNIEYQDFSKIDFSSLNKNKIPVPRKLKEKLKLSRYVTHVEKPELLEELIMKEVKKLGVKKTEIADLQPKEAIMLSMDVAAESLDYFRVDKDKEFIAKHGKHLPMEKCMQLGKGDCDKYTNIAVLSFNLFKKNNPKLNNVYLLEDSVGPEQAHAWVTLVILDNNEIITSALDPTFYDSKKELEGEKGIHTPYNESERVSDFYRLMRDFETEYSLLEEALQDNTLKEDDKERLSYKLVLTATILGTREEIESARDYYWKLERGDYIDEVLYWLYKFEVDEKNPERAEIYKTWLLECCPDSFWAKKSTNQ